MFVHVSSPRTFHRAEGSNPCCPERSGFVASFNFMRDDSPSVEKHLNGAIYCGSVHPFYRKRNAVSVKKGLDIVGRKDFHGFVTFPQ